MSGMMQILKNKKIQICRRKKNKYNQKNKRKNKNRLI